MRSRLRAVAVLTATAGALAAAPHLTAVGADPAPRSVAVNQVYRAPASGHYTVRGHGYGHGHGMSQYGAQGAARQGLTHEQILRFYYPGTTLDSAKKKIRVLLTADTTPDVVVANRSGLEVRDVGTNTWYPVPQDVDATRWRITVNGGNRNVVDYLAGGTWHRWSPGGSPALVGEGEFRAAGPLQLFTPSGDTTYRGTLRAAQPSPSSTNRDTVNYVGLDAYVRGVVASEMPALWEPEAVQTQAVAARTYGVFERAENSGEYYHICDTTACQVYHGVDGEHPAGNRAVKATARQVLRYGGDPAFTQFSSSSGGWLSAGGFPYLVAKKDPYDGWSGNPNHTWQVRLNVATIQRAYPSLGKLRRIKVTARDGHGQWQGRVVSMVLVGRRNNVSLSGDAFRSTFGLKSSWFSF